LIEQYGVGVESARADLFDRATIGIAAPSGTPAEALKLADDLANLVGAKTIFVDMLEADGMLMTAHLLPQALAAALLNATVGQPGWTETRRFAGRPFAQASAALGSDSLSGLALGLLNNQVGALNALDNVIGALTHIRAAVQRGDKEDLERRLTLAFDDREKWLSERQRAEWSAQEEKSSMPKAGDALKRMFMGQRPKDKNK
jgi:prephenate dehydrogenase